VVRTTHDDGDRWREQVEDKYGGTLPDETWTALEGGRYVHSLDTGAYTIEEVVDDLRWFNRVAPAAHSRGRRRVRPSDPESASVFAGLNNRLQALAEVIAWRAARSSAVSVYRRRWLGDKLIDLDQVAAWIDRTYHDHLPKNWPTDRGPAQATNVRGQFALWPHAHRVLEWIDTAAASTSKIWCVPRRGPLGDLARLVEKLADQWDWNRALATMFVLTGDTPARPGVRAVSFRRRGGSDDAYGSYDLMSVRCSIDIEVTPEELGAWWRGVRAALGITGRRPMGNKSVALAKFALSRTDDSKTFRDDMNDWNAEVPEAWRFDDYRNFRTAEYKAVEALNRPAAGCNFPVG
jgi:hypothetical protein